MSIRKEKLQAVLDKTVDNKKVFGACFALKHKDEKWYGNAGNILEDQSYFIASTTKLFTTALILRFQSKGLLSIDDHISRYIDADVLEGLMVFKGEDLSRTITIKHLLSHSSGIPDYFEGKSKNGISLEDEIVQGNDQSWSFEELINVSKSMKPQFAPGTKGKALYSDTNFQLLGKIIEQLSGESYSQNCEEHICRPLKMEHTYLYSDPEDTKPLTFYYKQDELRIPKAMSCFGPDGGMVSTNKDMLIFIEAFFTGKLFPAEYIEALQQWNKIFFPLQSGVGIQRLKLPWILDLGSTPKLMGHSGLSGALAFYAPEENIFVVGTVNQIAYPEKSFNVMVKLIRQLKKS